MTLTSFALPWQLHRGVHRPRRRVPQEVYRTEVPDAIDPTAPQQAPEEEEDAVVTFDDVNATPVAYSVATGLSSRVALKEKIEVILRNRLAQVEKRRYEPRSQREPDGFAARDPDEEGKHAASRAEAHVDALAAFAAHSTIYKAFLDSVVGHARELLRCYKRKSSEHADLVVLTETADARNAAATAALKQKHLAMTHHLKQAVEASRAEQTRLTQAAALKDRALEKLTDALAAAEKATERQTAAANASAARARDVRIVLQDLQQKADGFVGENTLLLGIAQYNEDLMREIGKLKDQVEEQKRQADGERKASDAVRQKAAAQAATCRDIARSLNRKCALLEGELRVSLDTQRDARNGLAEATRCNETLRDTHTPRPSYATVYDGPIDFGQHPPSPPVSPSSPKAMSRRELGLSFASGLSTSAATIKRSFAQPFHLHAPPPEAAAAALALDLDAVVEAAAGDGRRGKLPGPVQRAIKAALQPRVNGAELAAFVGPAAPPGGGVVAKAPTRRVVGFLLAERAQFVAGLAAALRRLHAAESVAAFLKTDADDPLLARVADAIPPGRFLVGLGTHPRAPAHLRHSGFVKYRHLAAADARALLHDFDRWLDATGKLAEALSFSTKPDQLLRAWFDSKGDSTEAAAEIAYSLADVCRRSLEADLEVFHRWCHGEASYAQYRKVVSDVELLFSLCLDASGVDAGQEPSGVLKTKTVYNLLQAFRVRTDGEMVRLRAAAHKDAARYPAKKKAAGRSDEMLWKPALFGVSDEPATPKSPQIDSGLAGTCDGNELLACLRELSASDVDEMRVETEQLVHYTAVETAAGEKVTTRGLFAKCLAVVEPAASDAVVAQHLEFAFGPGSQHAPALDVLRRLAPTFSVFRLTKKPDVKPRSVKRWVTPSIVAAAKQAASELNARTYLDGEG
ncbi:hypothetical protein DIPPA_33888 [Diplonema papillatum]|nr:hypothetical protein DIPPA_33888 [Diplonema papillatum]